MLCGLYSKTLSLLQGFPKEASYRHQTEQVVQQRMQIVQAESDIAVIEKKIGCGQVEELIDQVGGVLFTIEGHRIELPTVSQAERELSLTSKMEEWHPWQPLLSDPPPNQWQWP